MQRQDEIAVEIRIARGALRKEALRFIETLAFRYYHAAPPAPPQHLFVARRLGEVVGTIGADFVAANGELPLEKIWEFKKAELIPTFSSIDAVQFGRWMASERGVSDLLFYAATFFAQSHGKVTCLCEAKTVIIRHLRAMGFLPVFVPNARLLLGNIPERGLPYYETDPPKLFLMELESMRRALAGRIRPLDSITMSFQSSLA